MPLENLHYSIEEFSEAGDLIEVLARVRDLDAARAAFDTCRVKYPTKLLFLRRKAQVLRRSES